MGVPCPVPRCPWPVLRRPWSVQRQSLAAAYEAGVEFLGGVMTTPLRGNVLHEVPIKN